MPPKFGEKRLRTVGDFWPTPYIFALGDTANLTAWTLYNRQQANFGTCYVVTRAYGLEQQNAGRAHAGLCHASSFVYYDNMKLIIGESASHDRLIIIIKVSVRSFIYEGCYDLGGVMS